MVDRRVYRQDSVESHTCYLLLSGRRLARYAWTNSETLFGCEGARPGHGVEEGLEISEGCEQITGTVK